MKHHYDDQQRPFRSLPREIMENIFLRISAGKSLLKTVCKSWRSLIRSLIFPNMHLERQLSCFIVFPDPLSPAVFQFHHAESLESLSMWDLGLVVIASYAFHSIQNLTCFYGIRQSDLLWFRDEWLHGVKVSYTLC